MPPPNSIQTIKPSHDGTYIVEYNADIPLRDGGLCRCNVYRPLDTLASANSKNNVGDSGGKARYPVLMTSGPYGKDIPYSDFHPKSYAELNPEHKGPEAAWEVPFPPYWVSRGFVVVRVDERGTGQSPGRMDILSGTTARDFADCVEWAADQPWSTGKVGLTGVSYYAVVQWRVAALRPRGLAAIVPWEGALDNYNAFRHGGILSNGFLEFWYPRQVTSNQYGLPGKADRKWGPDSIDGDLSEEQLRQNHHDFVLTLREQSHDDDEFFVDSSCDPSKIEVPLLSVANWGAYALHLRGNVTAYMYAASKNKWLFFVTGRHDLPYYRTEAAALQLSFLNAFLKGEDDRGWLKGPNVDVPAIDMVVRRGNPGVDNEEAEQAMPTRTETAWPLPGTEHMPYYLNADRSLSLRPSDGQGTMEYEGLTGESIYFVTEPFAEATEFTGHPVATLYMSLEASEPKDLDVFVSVHHLDANGEEIVYTGSNGGAIVVAKGWLRASLRKINDRHPFHKPYQPRRDYKRADAELLQPGKVYELVVEIWPTNVVVDKGSRLSFEIAPKDTCHNGFWRHDDPADRNAAKLGCVNKLHFGPQYLNRIVLPFVRR